LPTDLAVSDKLKLYVWHYSDGCSTGTVHIGKNNTTDAGASNAAGLTEFSTAVEADLETVGHSAFSDTKSSTSEVTITCTSDMVTHAAAGKGFSLGFKKGSGGTYLYCMCVTLLLERA
jgi:hypothetical protein